MPQPGMLWSWRREESGELAKEIENEKRGYKNKSAGAEKCGQEGDVQRATTRVLA
jgi:hypothetical protein